jgi:NAD(P)-dependent dehydrogenase (short-subunit alcohol dehydrogenase family)
MRIIVTGGNSGIGRETAAALAVAGHRVLIAGRDISKAERAAAEMAGDYHPDRAKSKRHSPIDKPLIMSRSKGMLRTPSEELLCTT